MPTLSDKFKGMKAKAQSTEPVWKGPNSNDWNGGITYSMLCRFLNCRERFRVKYILGLETHGTFNPSIEYGHMWHACEEGLAAGHHWNAHLDLYLQQVIKRYSTQQEQIWKYYNVCKVQFPIYVDWWKQHPDVQQRTPLLQEQVFDVKYKLPSGRYVRLRGKWDSVDAVTHRRQKRLWVQENKTKSSPDEQSVQQQLQADLQTMLYLIPLRHECSGGAPYKFPGLQGQQIAGVRYNVIRRPLSGGKHSIKPHKQRGKKKITPAETMDAFYARLGKLIASEPEFFFMRWNAEVSPAEVLRFEQRTLVPILEQVCDWWEYMKMVEFDPWNKEQPCNNYIHWQHPHGVYNVLNEGGHTELDEYLSNGSELGLERNETLFKELVE